MEVVPTLEVYPGTAKLREKKCIPGYPGREEDRAVLSGDHVITHTCRKRSPSIVSVNVRVTLSIKGSTRYPGMEFPIPPDSDSHNDKDSALPNIVRHFL